MAHLEVPFQLSEFDRGYLAALRQVETQARKDMLMSLKIAENAKARTDEFLNKVRAKYPKDAKVTLDMETGGGKAIWEEKTVIDELLGQVANVPEWQVETTASQPPPKD